MYKAKVDRLAKYRIRDSSKTNNQYGLPNVNEEAKKDIEKSRKLADLNEARSAQQMALTLGKSYNEMIGDVKFSPITKRLDRINQTIQETSPLEVNEKAEKKEDRIRVKSSLKKYLDFIEGLARNIGQVINDREAVSNVNNLLGQIRSDINTKFKETKSKSKRSRSYFDNQIKKVQEDLTRIRDSLAQPNVSVELNQMKNQIEILSQQVAQLQNEQPAPQIQEPKPPEPPTEENQESISNEPKPNEPPSEENQEKQEPKPNEPPSEENQEEDLESKDLLESFNILIPMIYSTATASANKAYQSFIDRTKLHERSEEELQKFLDELMKKREFWEKPISNPNSPIMISLIKKNVNPYNNNDVGEVNEFLNKIVSSNIKDETLQGATKQNELVVEIKKRRFGKEAMEYMREEAMKRKLKNLFKRKMAVDRFAKAFDTLPEDE